MSNVWIELGLNRVEPRAQDAVPAAPDPAAASNVAPAAPGVLPDLVASLLTHIGDLAPESLGPRATVFCAAR